MTKANLIEKVSDVSNLTLKESVDIVESVLEIIKETLEKGETLKISGFGNFSVKQKHARRGRNPQTGKAIKIAAKTNGKFTPGKALKDLTAKPVKAAPKAKAPAKKK